MKLTRFSLLRLDQRNEQARKEAFMAYMNGLRPLNRAIQALQQEPYAIDDMYRGVEADSFWAQLLTGMNEIFKASTEDGKFVAIHVLSCIAPKRFCNWEVFVAPQFRNGAKAPLESAEEVLEYCFQPFPEGLGVSKVRAMVHPENQDALGYLEHLGFNFVGECRYEASFHGEHSSMLLCELYNPILEGMERVEAEDLSSPDEEEEDPWGAQPKRPEPEPPRDNVRPLRREEASEDDYDKPGDLIANVRNAANVNGGRGDTEGSSIHEPWGLLGAYVQSMDVDQRGPVDDRPRGDERQRREVAPSRPAGYQRQSIPGAGRRHS